jgi:hypothetical protein
MDGASLSERDSTLRRVNEAIQRGFWPGEDGNIVRIRCECGRFACNQFVQMRIAEYEQVRGNSRHFIVQDGHQTLSVEQVVRREPTYLVVEKTGQAGHEAEQADPRGV